MKNLFRFKLANFHKLKEVIPTHLSSYSGFQPVTSDRFMQQKNCVNY